MRAALFLFHFFRQRLMVHRGRILGVLSLFRWDPTWNRSLVSELEGQVKKRPNAPFCYFEETMYTYDEMNRAVNRHAHAYKSLGIARGDVVALIIENRPEFFMHLFGIQKIGAIASLINPDLTGDPLTHAVESCKAKMIVLDLAKAQAVKEVADRWPAVGDDIYIDLESGQEGADAPFRDWSPNLKGQPDSNPPETGSIRLDDVGAYIYTSGTTGLPKPAVVKHHKFWRAGLAFGGIAFETTPYNNIYCCLPLYHGNGILIATPSAVMNGGAITVARKFSATRFWDDIKRYQCDSFIYIGEILRYLLNQPPKPYDKLNLVRRIEGNGLRIEIWEEFKKRFAIENIAEHYAATEGNIETLNFLSIPGAVGSIMPWKHKIVRYDIDNEEFFRDANGRLIPCKAGESGVILGKIDRKSEFVGYTNKSETDKKILRDCFKEGDAWFNSGDVLKRDWRGQLYFVDRLGDTFRWKGQNVSTQEVATEVNRVDWIDETTVIGAQIPGTEGRAGLAAVVLTEGKEFDGADLFARLQKNLPAYAQPVFVRIQPEIDLTYTFKHDKKTLKKEGIDPTVVPDPMYLRDAKEKSYVPYAKETHEKVLGGEVAI